MANVDYKDLWWQVRAELPGVPTPLLYGHYAEAVRTFFLKSLAWQHSCPNPVDLAADTAWPTLVLPTDIPDDTYVVQPVLVKWDDGTVITFKTRDQLDELDSTWEQSTGSIPKHWTITSPMAWRLYPLLSASTTGQLYLRVALAPTAGAAAIPEELAAEWQDVWAHGALSRLMRIPGKDWTNKGLANDYLSMYESAVADAKSRAAADYGRPHRFVRYGGLNIGGNPSGTRDDYGRS